jgi:hypothetical protein
MKRVVVGLVGLVALGWVASVARYNVLEIPIATEPASCPADTICMWAEEPIPGFQFLKVKPSGGSYSEVVTGIGGQLYPLPFTTRAAGEYFVYGSYDYATEDANLTEGSPTVTFGDANAGYLSWAFALPGGAGTADGDCDLTVTGTTFNTLTGVRAAGQTQTLIDDVTTAVLNTRAESDINTRFIGQVSFDLTLNTGTTCALTFNYGLMREERADTSKVYFRRFEVEVIAGANDSGFKVDILRSTLTNWTYAATGFVAGPAPFDSSTHMAPEDNLVNRKVWSWKEFTSLYIDGSAGEGIVVRVTTTANNAVDSGYINLSTQFVGF